MRTDNAQMRTNDNDNERQPRISRMAADYGNNDNGGNHRGAQITHR